MIHFSCSLFVSFSTKLALYAEYSYYTYYLVFQMPLKYLQI